MHYDLIIVGAGPAGIFTALELLKNNIGKHAIVKLLNVSYEEVEILELEYCSKRRWFPIKKPVF